MTPDYSAMGCRLPPGAKGNNLEQSSSFPPRAISGEEFSYGPTSQAAGEMST